VTACDISSHAVALLADTLKGEDNGPRIDVISERLPYQDRSFDIVIAHGVFDHIPREGRSNWTNEVARVLKDNGLLYASLIAGSAHGAESSPFGEVILEEGEEAGLTQTFYTPEMIVSEYGRLFDIRSIAYDNRGLAYPDRRIIEHRFWAILQRR
jgi:SAM-dependent methyltransferase